MICLPRRPENCHLLAGPFYHGTKAKLAAVVEAGRGVHEHRRRIDRCDKRLGRLPIFGDNRIGVVAIARE